MNINEIPLEERYGYHIIATVEDRKRFSPKLGTDEVLENSQWRTINGGNSDYTCVCGFIKNCVYRRRIDVGEGFELVPLDEVGSNTCQWTYDGVDWTNASNYPAGKTIRQAFSKDGGYIYPIAFRRRKTQASKSEWVSVKERLPEVNQQVLAYPPFNLDKEAGLSQSVEVYNPGAYRWQKVITHWMPLPPPPQPEKTEGELAWERYWGAWKDETRWTADNRIKHAFLAGRESKK